MLSDESKGDDSCFLIPICVNGVAIIVLLLFFFTPFPLFCRCIVSYVGYFLKLWGVVEVFGPSVGSSVVFPINDSDSTSIVGDGVGDCVDGSDSGSGFCVGVGLRSFSISTMVGVVVRVVCVGGVASFTGRSYGGGIWDATLLRSFSATSLFLKLKYSSESISKSNSPLMIRFRLRICSTAFALLWK